MQKDFLTLYVDPLWRRQAQHTPLLYPFWGNSLDSNKTPLQHALFERFGYNTDLYTITDALDEADMVLMPYSQNVVRRSFPTLLDECFALAQAAGKPLLVDGMSDIELPLALPNTFVLRWGGYRFLPREREIHFPPYADDLLQEFYNGELQLREKEAMPVVAFAGWAQISFKQKVRTILKELPERLRGIVDVRYRAIKKGVFFRRQAVEVLQRSSGVRANFLVRTSYSGHVDTAVKPPRELQKEFVTNLIESDYGLDVRGDPNTSTRLFETASLGRIPVVLDTERNLPFSSVLDYSSFCLIVDFRDIEHLGERIAQFHANSTPQKFQDMQKNARKAYIEFFRTDALMRNLIRELRSQGALAKSA